MPLIFIITKLLLLKILIAGNLAYEYGYNPSAEEFDSLLRETSRTWTRNLLSNERQHQSWQAISPSHRRSDTLSDDVRKNVNSFVPKFKYDRERQTYDSALNLKWPGYAEKIVRKTQPMIQDQQSAASTTINQNIGSSLDFTMFSDEIPIPINEPNTLPTKSSIAVENSDLNKTNEFQSAFNTKKSIKQQQKLTSTTKNPLQGTVIQINPDSSERTQPNVPSYSINNLYRNNTNANFPIFFTNPATGIVYAITEIGRMDESLKPTRQNKNNNTIPIYITKEQYDRDIFRLKQTYEDQCKTVSNSILSSNNNNNKNKFSIKPASESNVLSTLSSSLTTTHRPQIIRLQKPQTNTLTISKLPVSKQPSNSNHRQPPPVMVETGLTVNNQVQLPPPKRLQKLKNKRKKKKKRPGRKSTGSITKNSTMNDLNPQILMGVRASSTTGTPTKNKDGFKTQLERPSLPTTTIFSNRAIASASGSVVPPPQKKIPQLSSQSNHHLSKRSITTTTTQKPTIITKPTTKIVSRNLPLPSVGITSKLLFETPNHQNPARRLPIKKKSLPKLAANATRTLTKSHLSSHLGNRTFRFVRKRQPKTTPPPKDANKGVTNSQHNLANSNRNHTNLKPKRKGSKLQKETNRGKEKGEGFNLFGLLDDISDDNSNDKPDDDDDDDYYDYYDDEKKKATVSSTKKPKRKPNGSPSTQASLSIDDEDETTEEVHNDLKEQITHDNSSSAEEGADFGALEEFDTPIESQQEPTPESEAEDFSSEKHNTYSKKRIRRRPPSNRDSYEDYNDDDEDDDGGGVGGFFRMIFYPVQLAMSRVFEGLGGPGGGDDSSEDKPYPTYTQYNSASNVGDDSSEDQEVQGNSLTSWITSLFGFNRRTKNIGSTTVAPITPKPLPTKAPGWFDRWFGFSGNEASAETTEDYDDYDKWFSSWFSTKPKAKRRTATTTTTTTATIPQVPILTIVDPMKNPQNWLGILAHHIINSTSTTTHNPIMQALTRATTTENPDIPRYTSYDKYQIWRLKSQDESQVKALEEYKRSDEGAKLQWLKGPSMRGLTDVLVPPKMLIDFEATLQFESIAHEILIFDVGKAISYEQNKEQYLLTTPRPTKHHHKYAPLIDMSWNKYYNYDDIVKYLESIRMRHPQIVELFHIGRSYEGRPLIVAKLEMKQSHGGSHGASTQNQSHKKLKYKKKSGHASAVFIEAGTHGLEWIGPATATWMINELLRIMKSNKSSIESEFIRNTTWYIMPVLNPDGYAYSHEYDRFWRKSRSRHISRPNGLLDSAMTWLQQKKNPEKVCYGVDLDRNWHYQWGKRGSSKSPCNEHYAGPTPFSEPETKALSEFLMDNRKQIKLYISMQAYGQIISYPIKANVTFDAERLDDFVDVAMVGTDGLRKKGSKSRYKIDSSNDLLEHRAGCSDAFAAYEVGIPFSYTLYLADNGVHGYLLPSSSIESTARDSFEIITAMLDYI